MIITTHDVDFEKFRAYCQTNAVIEGFYLHAYLNEKNATLQNWIDR